MPSPFPGMDPFLEDPAIFPDLHNSLITYLREALNAVLPAPYFAATASRVWVEASERRIEPDVDVLRTTHSANGGAHEGGGGGVATAATTATDPVVVEIALEETRETYLEIHARSDGDRLVTAIEILSPANKSAVGRGRVPYLQKQDEIMRSRVHLVEIDLLRDGVPTTVVPVEAAVRAAGVFDYHVCVRRWDRPRVCFLYPIQLTGRLPVVSVPLLPDDPPVAVDLRAVLDRAYDSGQYRRRVRYRGAVPPPPLHLDQARWVEETLRAAGLRDAALPDPPTPEPTA